MATVDVFQTTIMKSAQWLDEILRQLGIADERKALRVLRAGLHTIRDHLPDGEALDLGAQLPTLLRGVYYEGWRPGARRERPHSQDEIFAEVRTTLEDPTLDPELALRAAIRVMAWHVAAGELDDIAGTLPRPLAQIWSDACA